MTIPVHAVGDELALSETRVMRCVGGPMDGQTMELPLYQMAAKVPVRGPYWEFRYATYYVTPLRGEKEEFWFLRLEDVSVDEAFQVLLGGYRGVVA